MLGAFSAAKNSAHVSARNSVDNNNRVVSSRTPVKSHRVQAIIDADSDVETRIHADNYDDSLRQIEDEELAEYLSTQTPVFPMVDYHDSDSQEDSDMDDHGILDMA
jgi:hypothetical protein